MVSKRIAALLLASLVAWGSTGCIFLAKPVYEKVKDVADEEDDDEKQEQ